MNVRELNELISDGESERIEFKRSTGQRTEAAKAVCAMFNGLGGFVLFGVNNKGEVIPQVTEQVTEQVGRVVEALGENVLAGQEVMERLGLSHRPTLLYSYLQPAIEAGLVEMTIPDKPRSSKQKYRLTDKGRQVLAKIEGDGK